MTTRTDVENAIAKAKIKDLDIRRRINSIRKLMEENSTNNTVLMQQVEDLKLPLTRLIKVDDAYSALPSELRNKMLMIHAEAHAKTYHWSTENRWDISKEDQIKSMSGLL